MLQGEYVDGCGSGSGTRSGLVQTCGVGSRVGSSRVWTDPEPDMDPTGVLALRNSIYLRNYGGYSAEVNF